MARICKAALTLTGQVKDERKRARWSEHGEADGLDIIRAVRFDKSTGAWLKPLLEETADPRIKSLDQTEKGLVVTFVDSTQADYRHRFILPA